MHFDAFISYSHAFDGQLAPAVQNGLQRLTKPWYKLRALRIFRDETGLTVNTALWASIEVALNNSKFFILMASPQAAKSKWVDREIQHWLAKDPEAKDRILIVLTEGELFWDSQSNDFDWQRSTNVSKVLSGVFKEEPRYLDLRWARSETQLDLRHSQFRNAIADIAAPIHESDKDDLESEDIRQQRLTLRIAWTAGIGLVVLLAIAMIAGFFAQRNANLARAEAALRAKQQAIAEEQRQIAVAGRLAAQARNRMIDNPPLSLLLALESQKIAQTDEAAQLIAELPYYYPPQAEIFSAHTGPVGSVAWNPIEPILASGGEDSAIILWDANTGQIITKLAGPTEDAVGALAWSPDGSQLAASYWSSFRIWDIKKNNYTELELKNVVALFGANDIAWSTDGSRIAGVTQYSGIVWDLMKRQVTSRLQGHHVGLAAVSEMADVAFSPDGTRLATSADDRTVVIWDLSTNLPIMRLEKAHTSSITSIAWSPDGSKIASGSGAHHPHPGDNTVVVWDLTKHQRSTTMIIEDPHRKVNVDLGVPIFTLRGHSGGVNSVVWSPNGKLLASASDDGTIILWDAVSGKPFARLIGHGGGVYSVAFSPDGTRLVSGSDDKSVLVWTITEDQLPALLEGHTGEITSLIWSHDGKKLISGSKDTTIIVWDVNSRKAIHTLAAHSLPVLDLTLNPDDTQLVSATINRPHMGGNIRWDIASGEIIDIEGQPYNCCGTVAWSPDGMLLATASIPYGLAIKDFATQSYDSIGALPIIKDCIDAMEFSPDGTQLLMGVFGDLLLWNIESNNTSITLNGNIEKISSVSWSPDSLKVAAAGSSQVGVWDVSKRNLILSLEGYSSVDWSVDGKYLISPEGYNKVAVWDSITGDKITTLSGHTGSVTCVAISPDGKQLATGGADRRIRIINVWRFLKSPCKWSLRNMSADDWYVYFPDEDYRQTCP
jgi:WD40 repeat protein